MSLKQIRTKILASENKFWSKKRSYLAPSLLQYDYLHYFYLHFFIEKSFGLIKKGSGKKKFRIIDIGCGTKPYKKLFENNCSSYTGVDPEADAEIKSHAEALPVKSSVFDLALCFQVLEHTQDPQKTVDEIRRVLKKGNYAILSTHGIWHYHPGPTDFFRWTDEGLKYLFRDFSEVRVFPTLKTYSTIIQLVNLELYSLACRNIVLKLPLYSIIFLLNLLGKSLINHGLKHFSINYVVMAKK